MSTYSNTTKTLSNVIERGKLSW